MSRGEDNLTFTTKVEDAKQLMHFNKGGGEDFKVDSLLNCEIWWPNISGKLS